MSPVSGYTMAQVEDSIQLWIVCRLSRQHGKPRTMPSWFPQAECIRWNGRVVFSWDSSTIHHREWFHCESVRHSFRPPRHSTIGHKAVLSCASFWNKTVIFRYSSWLWIIGPFTAFWSKAEKLFARGLLIWQKIMANSSCSSCLFRLVHYETKNSSIIWVSFFFWNFL